MNRHFFSILTLLLLALLTSCRESREVNTLLSQADSLMNTRPDSALQILEEAREEVASCPRSQRMRHELLVAKAQNKAYVDFTTDSIMLTVTDYYDHHGTPNERMLAHYLLGCTYRDLGEAPRTLECYKDAVACADTLSPDCDYRTMMSIYGQIGMLYENQAMPTEEIEANRAAGKYALLFGDTLSYIKSIDRLSPAYSMLADTSKVFETTKTAYDLFLKYGNDTEAARCLPTAIATYILYDQYDKAKELMDEFESKSGYFDTDGSIAPQRSHYYNSKGLYYLGTSQLDSAEYYFKKLLAHGFGYDATKGLIKVYDKLGKNDSVSKYIKEFEDYQNSYMASITQESVRQTEAMYDYARHQQIAHAANLEKERTRHMLQMSIVAFIALLSIGVLYFRDQRSKRQREIARISNEYQVLSTSYEKTIKDLSLSRENFSRYESQKIEEIEQMQQSLRTLRKSLELLTSKDKKKEILSQSIIQDFQALTVPSPKIVRPTEQQWEELINTTEHHHPSFYSIISKSDLTLAESKIAILTYLDFTSGDIALLMNLPKQRISNAKRNANKKMFGQEDAASFKENIDKSLHFNSQIQNS